jgi:2-hydroxychromene-2-carboxylate isomerase
MRIEQPAPRHDGRIVWQPFLLGPIFRALGVENCPFVLCEENGAYVWPDMVRQCRKYRLRWTQPSTFPCLGVQPLRLALLRAEQAWIGAFCRRVMALNVVLDQDINDPAPMARILSDFGLPAAELLAQAQSVPVKLQPREQTELGRQNGIFGAPTCFVGTEMVWGNDRLDDALLLAAGS